MTDMTVPEKFRDPQSGALRVDALLKSYVELERRLGQMISLPGEGADDEERQRFLRALGVPDSPDDYDVRFDDARFAADPAVNRRLHQAGLTPAQVQVVYDLAAEHLGPAVERLGAEFEATRQAERLSDRFGGPEKWREIARQLKSWGETNLSPDVLHALSCTEEGVCAMHAMMQKGEPGFAAGSGASTVLSEADLTQMMRDPRYWKSRDRDFVSKVSAGFKRLYPD